MKTQNLRGTGRLPSGRGRRVPPVLHVVIRRRRSSLTPLNITGRQAEEALGEVNIVVNRNAIPYDEKPPRVASGMRLGTPAITSRGMGESEARQVGRLITRSLTNLGDSSVQSQVKSEVLDLTSRHPVPGIDV